MTTIDAIALPSRSDRPELRCSEGEGRGGEGGSEHCPGGQLILIPAAPVIASDSPTWAARTHARTAYPEQWANQHPVNIQHRTTNDQRRCSRRQAQSERHKCTLVDHFAFRSTYSPMSMHLVLLVHHRRGRHADRRTFSLPRLHCTIVLHL